MIPFSDENPTRRAAWLTPLLIVICIGVFVVVQPTGSQGLDVSTQELVDDIEFTYEYAAIPCELVEGRPLTGREIAATQLGGQADSCLAEPSGFTPFPDKNVWLAVLTSMFLHGGWLHLLGNMIFLWVFGNNIEDHLGRLNFALFYVSAGVVATAAHVVVQLESTVPVVGASGAIAGVMGAYLTWFPWARVRTIVIFGIIPIPLKLPAWLLLTAWFGSQFLLIDGSGIAWMAHVAGFIFGVVTGLVARSDDRFRNRLWAHKYRTTGKSPWNNRSGPPPRRA